MNNRICQVIRGKTIFVIHEYMFEVRSNNAKWQPLEDFLRVYRCNVTPGTFWLDTIHATDKAVRDAADL